MPLNRQNRPGSQFYENWESPELLQQHLASPELQQAIATAASELLDGDITIVPLRRIA
jgi:quinol monooxygenase YgiN